MHVRCKRGENILFFHQKEVGEKRKRVKKVLEEQVLNNLLKKFNNKFPSTQETQESTRTLTDRLGELVSTASKPRVSSAASNQGQVSNRKPSAGSSPNNFTDTRLQGFNLILYYLI